MDKICEICGKPTEDTLLEVGDHEAVCWECATKMAIQAREENREIEILLPHSRYYEECHLCNWCNELFTDSELREEADLGHLCDQCIQAIHSHGEPLLLKY